MKGRLAAIRESSEKGSKWGGKGHKRPANTWQTNAEERPSKRGAVKCFGCGGHGHMTHECPNPVLSKSKGSSKGDATDVKKDE